MNNYRLVFVHTALKERDQTQLITTLDGPIQESEIIVNCIVTQVGHKA